MLTVQELTGRRVYLIHGQYVITQMQPINRETPIFIVKPELVVIIK